MEIESAWPCYAVAAAALSIVALRMHLAYRARRTALAEVARQSGFRILNKRGITHLHSFLKNFDQLNQGYDQLISCAIQGTRHGRALAIFEHSYRTTRKEDFDAHAETVVAFSHKDAMLPQFRLSPENLVDKLLSGLGFQDIDFPDDPKFSQAFLLRGQDESAIRKLFSHAVRAELLSHSELVIEGAGPILLVYRPSNRYLRPEEVMPLVDTAEHIFRLLSRSKAA